MNNKDRLITGQFCDDIRQEMGNKISLMGCYSGEVILDNVPSLLSKFCASLAISSGISNPFQKLTARAYLNDALLGESIIPDDSLPKQDEIIKSSAFKDAINYSINIQMVFTPLLIQEDSTLRIEVETEDGVITGPRVIIRQRVEADSLVNKL